ncbi:DNA repair protein RecN [Pokkaliibacter sp. CJK22405]|uniref:DNA repair protein RecN n=1 Tax=Pokkaliibacter sp. CJK22405 TaxID=3384615 RepID=UPI003984B4FC
MLCQLSIKNVAIVEHLDLELPNGLQAISGETGAGKSIMLDSLALALGGRADAGCVRHGADKADISAGFDISQVPAAQEWLRSRDMYEENLCILRRTVTTEGRSRAWINGQPSNLQDLRDLGSYLVEIHGQHAHQRLLDATSHLFLLDDYAHLEEERLALTSSYQQWQQLSKRLNTLRERSDEDQARVQLLSYQVEELQQLSLQEGELASLEEEQKLLANAEHNLSLGQSLCELTRDSDDSLVDQIRRARSLLGQMQLKEESLSEIDAMLDSAAIQLEEAANSINHALDSYELSPERLQEVDQRLHQTYTLARKHRTDPNELLVFQQELEHELSLLDVNEDDLLQLEGDVQAAYQNYLAKAESLSEKRQQSALRLAQEVMEQLKALSMPHSHFEVAVTTLGEKHASINGIDRVEFLLSANPGQPARPLQKVASGGELSRISLAIQVVAAKASTMPTLIFDEVDVGIGGAVAEVVGKLLRQLGERVQVLCVTHQPQVAAQAHHHLFVSKDVRGGMTNSRVDTLSDEERINEIARMLGGSELSHHARAHAEAMLNQLPH